MAHDLLSQMDSSRQEVATTEEAAPEATVQLGIPWPGKWYARRPDPTTGEILPYPPSEKQRAFLTAPEFEILFGGAAGGGKSDALLMAASQFVHVPGYRAIIFRRRYVDLYVADGLVERSQQWFGHRAHFNNAHRAWTFESGATLGFGYLDAPNDHLNHQGAAYQFIGFDELTHFRERHYRYLFSRCRGTEDIKVPLRVRATANPGGVGHAWVYQRFFVEAKPEKRRFIQSKLADNPGFSGAAGEAYRASLSELDAVTRKQLEEGDWHVVDKGPLFDRAWMKREEALQATRLRNIVRYWDFAATPEKEEERNDPDYSVGALMAELEGRYVLLDLVRVRVSPFELKKLVRSVAEQDVYTWGRSVVTAWEQEGGSSGKIVADAILTDWLRGYMAKAIRVTGSKVERAKPLAVAMEQGLVSMQRGGWNNDFLDELHQFPFTAHDDQVDAVAGAFEELSQGMGSALPKLAMPRRM
jgi:predicted phage terminase large subunit-like protein